MLIIRESHNLFILDDKDNIGDDMSPIFCHLFLPERLEVTKLGFVISSTALGSSWVIQSILNCAVRIIYGHGIYNHIMLFLRDKLRWPWVPQRQQYKCCLFMYKALNRLAHSHISSYCTSIAKVQRCSTFCSATHLTTTSLFQNPEQSSSTAFFRWLVRQHGICFLTMSKPPH